MNTSSVVAQASPIGSAAGTHPLRVIKIAKPQGDQAVIVQLGYEQNYKLDFSAIANEKITLVHIGEKLIILFDNKTTVTVEPFFDSMNAPLPNVAVEAAGRDFSAAEFASAFPITTDQSVLSAAGLSGAFGAPASGADFHGPTVDPINSPDPLPLLGQEELPNWTISEILFTALRAIPDNIPTISGQVNGVVEEEARSQNSEGPFGNGNEDTNSASGDDHDTLADLSITGRSTDISLATLVHGGDQPLTFAINSAVNGTQVVDSNGHAVISHGTAVTYLQVSPTMLFGMAGGTVVFTIKLTDTANGTYRVTLNSQIDHPDHTIDTGSTSNGLLEETLALDLSAVVGGQDATGHSLVLPGANMFTVGVIDDTPVAHIALVGLNGISVDETATSGDEGADPFSYGTPLGVATSTIISVAGSNAGADLVGSSTHINFEIADGNGADSGLTTTDGIAIHLFLSGGIVEGRVDGSSNVAFALSMTDAGQLTVAQYLALHHSDTNSANDAVDLSGKLNAVVTVTDGDGDIATSSVNVGGLVSFLDDAPQAFADSNWTQQNGSDASGNVLVNQAHTGSPAGSFSDAADTLGVDGLGTLSWAGAANGAVAGSHGALSVDANGNYTYVLNNGDAAVAALPNGASLTDTFTYTVTDGDGDASSQKLTITIFGSDHGVTITNLKPEAQGGDAIVNEANLSDGSAPDAGDLTQTGTFNVRAQDGIDNLTVGTFTVFSGGSFVPGNHTTPFGNELTFTSYNPTTGEVTYTYTLADSAPHANGNGTNGLFENLTVVLTDTDGSTASDTLSIQIIDDVPTAVNVTDPDVLDDEGLTGGIAGNGSSTGDAAGELTSTGGSLGYTAGADGLQSLVLSGPTTLGTEGVTSTWSNITNTLTISSARGDIMTVTVTDLATGDYTVTLLKPVLHAAGGNENDATLLVNYTVTDNDGDTANGSLNVTINDDTPTMTSTQVVGSAVLYENDFTTNDLKGATVINISGNDGSIDGGQFVLTQEIQSQLNWLQIDGGPLFTGDFQAKFDLFIHDGGTLAMADGVSFQVGNDLNTTIFAEEPAVSGLALTFDTWDNGGPDVSNEIALWFGGVKFASLVLDPHSATPVPVEVTMEGTLVTVTYNGAIIFDHIDVGGTLPADSDFFFGARTGGAADFQAIDRVKITVPSSVLLTVDETTLGADATANFASAFAASYGADGAGDIQYALSVDGGNGANSGLVDSLTGDAVLLYMNGGHIEGRNSSNQIVFEIGVDTSGNVTLDQQRAVMHSIAMNSNDSMSIGSNLVMLTATVTDVDGDSASQSIDLGTKTRFLDDGPIAHDDTNSVATNGPAATGNVVTDAPGVDQVGADGLKSVIWTGSNGSAVAGAHGTLTVDASGHYSYALNGGDQAVASLSQGQSLAETFTYTITDADGDTSAATLTINIFGANDAPTAVADTNWVKEDTSASASGNVLQSLNHAGAPVGAFADHADTDTDATDTLTVSAVAGGSVGGAVAGTFGSVTINTDGSYTYTLNNGASNVQTLAEGQTATDTFAYTVTDGHGGTSTANLVVTVFGTNDAPVAVADTNWAKEDTNTSATGNVLQDQTHAGAPSSFADHADTDVDAGASLTVSAVNGGSVGGSVAGTYGSVKINADGSYTYTLNNSAANVQTLHDGQTAIDTFTYTVSDGQGGTSTANLVVTVYGTNDGLSITDLTPELQGGDATVNEANLSDGSLPNNAALTQAGWFKIQTPDGLDDLTVGGHSVINNGVFTATTFTTPLGNTLQFTSFDAATGQVNYTYTLTDNETHTAGNGANNLFENLPVVLTDLAGNSAPDTLSIKIVDDVPTATNHAASANEGGGTVDVVFIVDVSGSMGDSVSNVPNFSDDKLGLARYAMQQLITNHSEIKNVQLTLFSDGASSQVWMSRTDALTFINTNSNWNADGSTNYDAALNAEMNAYNASSRPLGASDQTLVYFLSDGEPNQPSANPGITNVGTGSDVSVAEWEAFAGAAANDISNVFAIGLGTGVGSAQVSNLQPISYPNTDTAAPIGTEDNVVIISSSNLTSLTSALDTLLANIISSSGNVLTDGGLTPMFGADGGHIQSITINGTVYTWNGQTGASSVIIETGAINSTINGATSVSVATGLGGQMTFYFAAGTGHNAGDWAYKSPVNVNADTHETFAYSVIDNDGDTSSAILDMGVVNVNVIPPSISSNGGGTTATISVAENSTAVTTVTSTDADGPAAAYSIIGGTDAAKFTINASTGVLSFVTAPNFEAPTDSNTNNSYVVQVQASDGSLTDTQTITVNVTNVNEAPTATIAAASYSATEQTNLNLHATGMSIADVDAGSNDITATLSVTQGILTISAGNSGTSISGNGTASVTITGSVAEINNLLGGIDTGAGSAGTIVYNASLDNPSATTTLTLFVNDTGDTGSGGAQTVTSTVTINVAGVNDAPVISSNGSGTTATISVNENTTAVTTVTSTDVDGPAATYLIIGGSDAAKFTINASTGALSFVSAPNFESPTDTGADNSYVVQVQASDGTLTDSQTITVNVTDVNEAPSAGADQVVSAAENVADTVTLATVTGTDPDVGGGNDGSNNFENLTYSIVGGNGAGLFEINGSGQISLANNQHLDFETAQQHVLTVRAADGPGLFDDVQITINVTNVNEAPTANDETVITNISGSGAVIGIPDAALLFNDVDPEGQTLTISSVGSASSGSVSHSGTTTTFTDNNTSGGSFSYTAQDAGSLTDTASVQVDRNQAGDPKLDGTGASEILLGSGSADTLIGNGGSDILVGGAGGDHFRFNATTDGMDRIIDFSTAQGDVIDIQGSTFGGLSTGTLSSTLFVSNAGGTLTSAAQRFAFDTTSHTLYYDADGSGAAAKIALAHLENGANLGNSDIHIV